MVISRALSRIFRSSTVYEENRGTIYPKKTLARCKRYFAAFTALSGVLFTVSSPLSVRNALSLLPQSSTCERRVSWRLIQTGVWEFLYDEGSLITSCSRSSVSACVYVCMSVYVHI